MDSSGTGCYFTRYSDLFITRFFTSLSFSSCFSCVLTRGRIFFHIYTCFLLFLSYYSSSFLIHTLVSRARTHTSTQHTHFLSFISLHVSDFLNFLHIFFNLRPISMFLFSHSPTLSSFLFPSLFFLSHPNNIKTHIPNLIDKN